MERISAWMDGELDDQEARAAMSRLLSEPEARSEWAQYQLIGDALRDQYLLSIDVAERVSARLIDEPTVLAPRRRVVSTRIKRYALSMAASAAAVAVVGWLAWSNGPLSPVDVASGPSPSPSLHLASNVRPYLLAHQEYSPATEIQGVAPYVRTVAEAPADAAR